MSCGVAEIEVKSLAPSCIWCVQGMSWDEQGRRRYGIKALKTAKRFFSSALRKLTEDTL